MVDTVHFFIIIGIVMSWIDRALQKDILEYLSNEYGKNCLTNNILEKICKNLSLDAEEIRDKFTKNIKYLEDHELLKISELEVKKGEYIHDYLLNMQYEHKNYPFYGSRHYLKITHKGIDFLEQNGSFSEILDVVTVKLHTDTIRDLIDAKIDASKYVRK